MTLSFHRAHKLAIGTSADGGASSLDNLAGRPRASGHFWETVALWSVLGMVVTGASMIGLALIIAAPAFLAFGAVAALANWRADVALSSACERRSRAAREPSCAWTWLMRRHLDDACIAAAIIATIDAEAAP